MGWNSWNKFGCTIDEKTCAVSHLYDVPYQVSDAAGMSDTGQDRFGIREVSYDLSLFDAKGAPRRVNVPDHRRRARRHPPGRRPSRRNQGKSARLGGVAHGRRRAHMNIIRNWMGNNAEEEFYDLADENGMMILNDFWQSTQNFQVGPDEAGLFLANARDTISRYRNHPSIHHIFWMLPAVVAVQPNCCGDT